MRRAQNDEGVHSSLYGSKMCCITRQWFVLLINSTTARGNDTIANKP